jgi:hypothetical protein
VSDEKLYTEAQVQKYILAARELGRAQERANIAAWLRGPVNESIMAPEDLAMSIESGEHDAGKVQS